jgi:hypothetical protein
MKTTTTIMTFGAVAAFALLSFKSGSSASIEGHTMTADVIPSSSNPPAARTGAPGEITCTGCHSGSVLSATGTVNFDFNVGSTAADYMPGQTYPMQISIANGNKNGFQLTILNGNNQKAGDFVNGQNTSTTLSGGRQYIRHSASNNITSFDFQWTAPSTNMGDLRAYYTFAKTNANGTNSGDQIYMGELAIPSGVPASINQIEENPNKIQTRWDAAAKQIHLDYSLAESSHVTVNVQSISGQLIQHTTLGEQNQGQYHQILSVNEVPAGVYIVAVFVNNRVFNYKMMLN